MERQDRRAVCKRTCETAPLMLTNSAAEPGAAEATRNHGMRSRTSSALAAALALSGAAASAQDSGPVGASLKTLAANAAAIVETRVARVDYRLGPGGAGAGALPYAVVTFEVLRRVGDASLPKSFRLRVVGGPDGSGGFYEVGLPPEKWSSVKYGF